MPLFSAPYALGYWSAMNIRPALLLSPSPGYLRIYYLFSQLGLPSINLGAN